MENTPSITPAPQSSGSPASNKKLWVLVIVILVLVFGCMATRRAGWFMSERMIERAIERSSGDNADVDVDLSGNTTITTENGTVTIGGNGSVPDSWPSDIDLPRGIKITTSGSANPQTGEVGSYMTYTTDDSIQEVLDYYKAELTAEGWENESTAAVGTTVAVGAKKGDRTFGMYAVNSNGMTMVTVGVSEDKD